MSQTPPIRQTPAVSVLMPVRNAEFTVEAAIQSVVSQSLTNWEFIIIDDGSIDTTTAKLRIATASDPRIQIHTLPPGGIANALNYGISRCRAPWIARMDADDVMAVDRLKAQLDFARANPDFGVISGLIAHGGSSGGFEKYVEWLNSVTRPLQIKLQRFIESPVAHPSVMFRRSLVHQFGGYRAGDFPEDYELWLRWLDAGVTFGKVPECVLTWNDSSTRATRTDPRYDSENFYNTKLAYLATWLRQNVDPDRKIWLWGAGRITRKRFARLSTHGIHICGFIDIDPKKCGTRRDGLRVVLPQHGPCPNDAFIITGVAKHGARAMVRQYLEKKGWIEGRDFIHAA